MITSMTGFGRGSAQANATTATVELRSVNKRFLEVSTRLPDGLSRLEPKLETLIKSAFERGRFTVDVTLDHQANNDLPLAFDAEAVAAYARLLEALRSAAGVQEPIDLGHLLHFSEHFVQAGAPIPEEEQVWEAIEAALQQAIDRLRHMRRDEGRALEADLRTQVESLVSILQEVEQRLPHRLDEAKTRLETRIAELLGQHDLDPDRLAQEVAFLTDRLDISEECVRLRSHTQLFQEALDSDDAVGRRLNFIIQEMHREVNTIGSKANDAEIAQHAVSMKEVIEKLREQIQNVE